MYQFLLTNGQTVPYTLLHSSDFLEKTDCDFIAKIFFNDKDEICAISYHQPIFISNEEVDNLISNALKSAKSYIYCCDFKKFDTTQNFFIKNIIHEDGTSFLQNKTPTMIYNMSFPLYV